MFIESDVLKVIQAKIDKLGIRGTARLYGMSPAHLNDIQKRRRGVSQNVARKFGYERERFVIINFRKIGG
jgi:hypothetical protein